MPGPARGKHPCERVTKGMEKADEQSYGHD
jgi:hypothetical protein